MVSQEHPRTPFPFKELQQQQQQQEEEEEEEEEEEGLLNYEDAPLLTPVDSRARLVTRRLNSSGQGKGAPFLA